MTHCGGVSCPRCAHLVRLLPEALYLPMQAEYVASVGKSVADEALSERIADSNGHGSALELGEAGADV